MIERRPTAHGLWDCCLLDASQPQVLGQGIVFGSQSQMLASPVCRSDEIRT